MYVLHSLGSVYSQEIQYTRKAIAIQQPVNLSAIFWPLREYIEPIKTTILLQICYPFSIQAQVFTCLQHKPLENTVGKGEIDRNE